MHAHTVLFFVEMFDNSVALGEPGTFLQWIYSLLMSSVSSYHLKLNP